MDIKERFEQRLQHQRQEFHACLYDESRMLFEQFTELGQAIIRAAIKHFNREPFSEREMANYLINTGQWPNIHRRRDTPERTVNTYCNQNKYIGWVFDSLGRARFRIKDKYPPALTGLPDRYHDFRTNPDKDRNELPCGCIVLLEPDLTISFIYCDMHDDTMRMLSKEKRQEVA